MTDHKVAIPGSNRPRRANVKVVGKCDPRKEIKLSIYARRNLHADVTGMPSLSDLKTLPPRKRRYLTDEQFSAIYGADPRDLEAIATWARENGMRVLSSSVQKRQVMVEGAIGDVNKAFGTELRDYVDSANVRHRGREGALQVPVALHDVIVGVFGLDNRRVGRSRLRRSRAVLPLHPSYPPPERARKTTKGWPGTFFPTELAPLYRFPANLDGSGENIGIFAFNGAPNGDPHGGYRLPALQTYFEQVLKGKTPSIKSVLVHGPGNDPGPDTAASDQRGDTTGEVMLDLCVAGALAPGAKIVVYFTEFTSQGWVDALHEAITDNNNISVISISYGNPEDDPDGAWTDMGLKIVDEAFEAAIARGITICVASGDDGSGDGEPTGVHVDFPASSPNVLGVGGTKLVVKKLGTRAVPSETVWNELRHHDGAGGGGVSVRFTRPDYQADVNMPSLVNPPHRIGRGVPDVAALADPQTGVICIHVSGRHLDLIGGTSAATPIWAALIARLNQGLGARCGFLNALLYRSFQKGVLRDVTVGNNGAYSACKGWDACTGLGAPDGQRLLDALSGSNSARAKRVRRSRARPTVRAKAVRA